MTIYYFRLARDCTYPYHRFNIAWYINSRVHIPFVKCVQRYFSLLMNEKSCFKQRLNDWPFSSVIICNNGCFVYRMFLNIDLFWFVLFSNIKDFYVYRVTKDTVILCSQWSKMKTLNFLDLRLVLDILHILYLRPVVAQGHKVWLQNRLVVDSIPTRGDEIFIYIYIFISSLWCRDKVVVGVEFRHSTRNASRIWRKVGNGMS